MPTLNKALLIGNKTISIQVCLNEVVNFNDDHGHEENDIRGICVNVMGDIGEKGSFYGQVQWDVQNNGYSADCDGNALCDELKKALLSNFDSSELYGEHGIESDLHCDLMNEVLPSIIKIVCDFAEIHADKYRNV